MEQRQLCRGATRQVGILLSGCRPGVAPAGRVSAGKKLIDSRCTERQAMASQRERFTIRPMPLSRPFVIAWRALTVWWDDWLNQLLLNLVWALCWLTVVLGPPATFALMYGAHELARGSSESLRALAPVARRYFGQAWAWFGLNLVAVAVLLSSIFFYGQIEQLWAYAFRWLIWFILLIWLGVQFYSLPLFFAQDEPSLRLAWRNGALLAAKYPLTTLVFLLLTLLILAFSLLTGILIGLGGVALVCVLAAVATRQLLARELDIELEPAGSLHED